MNAPRLPACVAAGKLTYGVRCAESNHSPEWTVCFLQGFGDLVNASQVVEKIGAPPPGEDDTISTPYPSKALLSDSRIQGSSHLALQKAFQPVREDMNPAGKMVAMRVEQRHRHRLRAV